jgi:hypothetical protein
MWPYEQRLTVDCKASGVFCVSLLVVG